MSLGKLCLAFSRSEELELMSKLGLWYDLLAYLQRACDTVGLGVAKVVAVVHPREVGPGQEDLLAAQHQLGPVDAQEVLAL